MKKTVVIFLYSIMSAYLFSMVEADAAEQRPLQVIKKEFNDHMDEFLSELGCLGFDTTREGAWAREDGLPHGWRMAGSNMLTRAKNIFDLEFLDEKGLLRVKYYERNHDYSPTVTKATIYFY